MPESIRNGLLLARFCVDSIANGAIAQFSRREGLVGHHDATPPLQGPSPIAECSRGRFGLDRTMVVPGAGTARLALARSIGRSDGACIGSTKTVMSWRR